MISATLKKFFLVLQELLHGKTNKQKRSRSRRTRKEAQLRVECAAILFLSESKDHTRFSTFML